MNWIWFNNGCHCCFIFCLGSKNTKIKNKKKTKKNKPNPTKPNKIKKSMSVAKFPTRLFQYCCKHGLLDIVQNVLAQHPFIRKSASFDNGFIVACVYGHIKLVQWLHARFDMRWTMQIGNCRALQVACKYGHVELARWLCSVEPGVMSYVTRELDNRSRHLATDALKNGHLEVVKWLFSIRPTIISNIFWSCFDATCGNGHLKAAKWILSVSDEHIHDMYLHHHYVTVFCSACVNGHLNVAKWLFTIIPAILVVRDNHIHVFRRTCENGHLHVVKWLLTIKPNIDLSRMKDTLQQPGVTIRNQLVIEWIDGLLRDRTRV